MTRDEIRKRLDGVFSSTFDEEISIKEEMTAADIESWDSLTHIQLVAAIEAEFRVRFTTREVIELKNVGDIITLIAAKTAA